MSAETREELDAECTVLTRYLVGHAPDPRVLETYAVAHARDPRLAPAPEEPRRERALVALARRGPRRARLADAHARLFAPRSRLRKKLVTLLAVLETRAPTDEELDTADGGSVAVFLARCALASVAFGLRAVAASALLPFVSAGGEEER